MSSLAITSVDAFTTAVNATAAGARSPLAIASLNELLHKGDADGISYVLSVKGLGGQSQEYTKDRHVGLDTYTTLADASVSFMLYDVAAQKIIKSGIANGVSSVHGRLGKPPTGLIGPNAEDAIADQAADAPPANQWASHPFRRGVGLLGAGPAGRDGVDGHGQDGADRAAASRAAMSAGAGAGGDLGAGL